MIAIFLLFFIIVLLIIKLLIINIKKFDLDKVPGPPGYPFIGNIFDVMVDRVTILKKAHVWTSAYRDIYKLSMLSSFYAIVISNPYDTETVLSTSVHNTKSYIYKFIQPWLQDGLLLSTGTKWQERRKMLTPAFHFNILRHFTTILEENSRQLVNTLKNEVGKPKINIIPFMSGYTLNCICETAMGTKIEDDTSGLGFKYEEAVCEMGTYCVERLTKCWLHFEWVFKLSPLGINHGKMLKVIREFPNKIINQRKQNREKHGDDFFFHGANDGELFMNKRKKIVVLDLLLDAEKENKIDRKGIQEEVDTFMFGGHDTAATALNYALMELANNQQIQDKVVEEIYSIFGESDRVATMEDLNQMKYLECCIKETLRLYPPAYFIGRELQKNVILSNYVIPAGTTCQISVLELHRRGDLYPNPLKFDPERFTPENSIGRHPYAFIPFSAGPRNCIGQKFAMLEMKSAISAILRQLRLKPITKPSEIEFSGDMVLRATNPIYVSFEERNKIK